VLPIIIFIAFVTVPMVEIALFIQVGGLIGLWPTLLTVILTAMIGTALLRSQGMKVLADAQETINKGGMPVEQAIHGVFLLISGLLLLTPGFMTDGIGFLLFVPPFRLWLGRKIFAWVKEHSTVTVFKSGNFDGNFPAGGAIFDEDDDFTPRQTPQPDGPAADNVVELTEEDFRGGRPDPNSPWAKGTDPQSDRDGQ